MAFDIPRRRILPVSRVQVRMLDGPHPFEAANKPAIAENWAREKAAKPNLFDGEIVLLADLRYRERALVGHCHKARYSTFLHWRRLRATESAEHVFAHAALVSGDGALVAIRMGPHTVNAGRVYFAAGSFEPIDFRGGEADLDFNMRREVLEETGLDLADARPEPLCHAYSDVAGNAIFRRYAFTDTADELAARIAAFVAREAEPEIVGPVVIRSAEDLPEGLMPHMLALVRWHFGAADPRSERTGDHE